jgi:hypothetical protein
LLPGVGGLESDRFASNSAESAGTVDPAGALEGAARRGLGN